MAITMTEREVFDLKMGRHLSDAEILDRAAKRDRRTILDTINNPDRIYKRCDICGQPICVNNWEDKKSRTPTFKDFVVCGNCDPRHPEDRYLKQGYRILFPQRVRVINFAQVARAMGRHGCLRPMTDGPCKCAGCAAGKLFPPPPIKNVPDSVLYG